MQFKIMNEYVRGGVIKLDREETDHNGEKRLV